jgi:valyl-tRNA synthetase
MMDEIPKIYDPKQVEKTVSELWNRIKAFHAEAGDGGCGRKSFTIVIPPPNVTAALHLGHALNNTLQDIMIRMKRMQGYNTLWMPGTDHAGIATQTVVEKRILAEEGKRRTDFQREEFVKRIQAWKDEYEKQIITQLQSMGCSCDWERTRFTMDAVCAKAVRATFFKLFADGLIYRGKRLVNWDPATQTVLADDEVEHETVQGHFWYLRYPLTEAVAIDGKKVLHVTVATTRPETMLGDTAVAMNPSDSRAKFLIGKKVRLPIVGREIPIIGDEHVVLPDPNSENEKAKFSTGFLKVTPAHDPDDYAIGQRHDLPIINVMAPDGSISDKHGWEDAGEPEAQQLIGLDRFEAREAIVEWFRQENLLEEVREYAHEVGHSYRSHVPIEPYLSDQWYIAVKKPIERSGTGFQPVKTMGKMPLPQNSATARMAVPQGMIEGTDVPVNSLAGLALKPLLDGRLRFIPERYAKTYQTWLDNLRDWPISRQLWWGHQIPIWRGTIEQLLPHARHAIDTLEKAREGFTADSRPSSIKTTIGNVEVCLQERIEEGKTYLYICIPEGNPDTENKISSWGFQRDNDVLDTWFSSALWPFSTMGWPVDTPEMKTFYPGNVLCTAREIITLWVSRMVMMGQYCAGDIPFSDVFIHAMIQDGQGRKMSKSLGNGIDPLVAIDSHGADAMRFALASMTTQTQDIRMPVEPLKLPDGRTINTSPKFDIGRNFCNKLWNASRFVLSNLPEGKLPPLDQSKLAMEDRWILSRWAATTQTVTENLEAYQFSEPINVLYKFFWNDLCDWYLEFIKPRMRNPETAGTVQRLSAFLLDNVLRLFHPFLPFITEGIYQHLNQICPERSLDGVVSLPGSPAMVTAAWPAAPAEIVDASVERDMETIQDVIRLIRDIRTQYNILPRQTLTATIKAPASRNELLNGQQHLIRHMANVETRLAGQDFVKPADAATAVHEDLEIYVHGVIDPDAEQKRLAAKKEELIAGIGRCEAKLGNESFVNRAKPDVVERERQRLAQLKEQLAAIEKNL